MFKRIAIDNYRCFSNFDFEPGRMNLLLGANGSGKSSLFDLLAAICALVRAGINVDEAFPNRSRTRWDTRDRQRIELDVEGPDGTLEYLLVIRHDPAGAVIERESVTCKGRTLFAFEDGTVHLHKNDGSEGASFAFRGSRSFLAQIEQRPQTKDLMAFLRFLEGVWGLQLDVRAIDASSDEEQDKLVRDGSNFASWYRHLTQEHPDRLQALWSALTPVVPGLQSLKLLSGGRGRPRDLVASMLASGTAYDVDFDELSDGQRALVVLYTLLSGIQPREACMLLDEPEVHAGLAEVQPWLVALDERFEDCGQVFIISHHPEVVDYMAAATPFLFERPDGGPARARKAPFDRDSGDAASAQLARAIAVG